MNQSPHISEFRVVSGLALLYVFRMLGLFMVFPVMMLFGNQYGGATPVLLGMALGCYGLTQAVFQLPLGLLSDIWGRKPVIVLGLIVFGVGSALAALSDNVWGLIIGRGLQGAGAIASAVLALVGDLTAEENRTRAMAIIGASIGAAFSLALVLGPALAAMGGLPAVFWLSTCLALVGIAIIALWVPSPPAPPQRTASNWRALLPAALCNPHLLRLDLGIFVLHFMLTATFVAVPVALRNSGVAPENHWHYYLPIMVGAFIAMLPLMYLGERRGKLKPVFAGAIGLLIAAQLMLAAAAPLWQWLSGLVVFFIAFNLLEATLPSLVTRQAGAEAKGTALGIYSTCQFLGAAAGGALGGVCLAYYGMSSVFWIGGGLGLIWLLAALSMAAPRQLVSIVVPLPTSALTEKVLTNVPGVVSAKWRSDRAKLYLQVDMRVFQKQQLDEFIAAQQ